MKRGASPSTPLRLRVGVGWDLRDLPLPQEVSALLRGDLCAYVAVHQHGDVAAHGVKRLVNGGLNQRDFTPSPRTVGCDDQLGAGVSDPLRQGLRAED